MKTNHSAPVLLANPKGLKVYTEGNWLPQVSIHQAPRQSTAWKKKQAASLGRCHVAITPGLWTRVLRLTVTWNPVCPWTRWEPRGDTPVPRLEVLKVKSPSSLSPFLVSRRGEGEGQERHLESAQFVGFYVPWHHHLFSQCPQTLKASAFTPTNTTNFTLPVPI